MNMSYEMFLTMQLMYLACKKNHVQPPTRKEGWDLFRRTSDDNSKFVDVYVTSECILLCIFYVL